MSHHDDTCDVFARRGWLHLPSRASSALVARLREGAERLLGATLSEARAAATSDHVWQLPGPRLLDPTFADPELDTLVARITAPLLGAGAQVQLLQDVLLLKPPRCVGTIDWHRDYTYLGFIEPGAVVTLRLALTNSTPGMGCMEVLDTSHTWPGLRPLQAFTDTLDANELDALSPEHRAQVERYRTPISMKPGDVTVHHCKTVHGSFHNPTDNHRLSLLIRVFHPDCRLNPGLLPGPEARAHFQTTTTGHLHPEQFPVLDGAQPTGPNEQP